MKISFKIVLLYLSIFSYILNGKNVNLLYTANINATYKNCDCGPNPLGGIDRLKTFISDFRIKNSNTILIDGGNIFNSYPFVELNLKVLKSLSILQYDLFSPGIHIFFEKEIIYKEFYNKYKNSIMNSNSNLTKERYKDFKINDINIRLYSYISSELFKYSDKPDWLKLTRNIEDINYTTNGVNILIFNGYLNEAKDFLNIENQFDLVLLSSEQIKGKWQFQNTTILGVGHDAESIALVEISSSKDNLKFIITFFDMDSSIKSDNTIKNIFIESEMKTTSKDKI